MNYILLVYSCDFAGFKVLTGLSESTMCVHGPMVLLCLCGTLFCLRNAMSCAQCVDVIEDLPDNYG